MVHLLLLLNKYKIPTYEKPIIAPFFSPSFFIFIIALELEINTLIIPITNKHTGIVDSDIWVYASKKAYISIKRNKKPRHTFFV